MKLRCSCSVLGLFAALLVLAACSPGRSARPAGPAPAAAMSRVDPWPTRGWSASPPSVQGMDGARLDEAWEAARRDGLALHSMLVIRHGLIVKEAYSSPYRLDTPHELYSCTKSFVSALTGIAIERGLLRLGDPVTGFFPGTTFTNPDPRKGAMTVENLLTMSSGLAWVEADATYRELYTSTRDWVGYVLGLPMDADPGARFLYSSGNTHVLSAIIQNASRRNTYDFAREALFEPLGIRRPSWGRDPTGIPIGGWGLQLAPRDMAKLGYLYLHDGQWDGKQVVPAAWVRESTRTHITAPGTLSYGYQWWIDSRLPLYAALGRFGQGIYVVPGLDLVVVFTAQIETGDPELDLIRRFIVPACGSEPVTSS